MYKKLTLLVLFVILFSTQSFAQFDKPIITVSAGIVEPFGDFKGGDYVRRDANGYIFIDSNIITQNYGAKTGFHLGGQAKFNFDKYAITRGVLFASYNSFNTFQSDQSGTTTVRVGNTLFGRNINYSYSLNVLSIGAGFELAPLAFTNVVSPFANVNFSANFINGELTRNTTVNDTNRTEFGGVRFGVNFNGGIEFRINNQFGIAAGIKYDLANLLGKSTSNDQFVEWGSTNASLNDDGGRIISNLPKGLGESYEFYYPKKREISWGTAYLALNIFINQTKPKSKTRR